MSGATAAATKGFVDGTARQNTGSGSVSTLLCKVHYSECITGVETDIITSKTRLHTG